MIDIEQITKLTGLHEYKLKNIYIFGSTVYSTNDETSDIDILVIANTSSPETEFKSDKLNIHVLSEDRFRDGLKNHNIRNIECLLAPKKFILKEDIKIDLEINEFGFRHAISHTNQNSWVKGIKKINNGEIYIGKKSLFHSIRILIFAIQIGKVGYIENFSHANDIWNDIKYSKKTSKELDAQYRELRNSLASEFRKLFKKQLKTN